MSFTNQKKRNNSVNKFTDAEGLKAENFSTSTIHFNMAADDMVTIISNPQIKQTVAIGFSTIFFLFSLSLVTMMFSEIITGLLESQKIISIFLNAINTAVVALAIFELGTVVSKEYCHNEESHIVVVLRRTLPRFVSIVCIALALEGLLMVIKYSHLDLAGNLYYPVAIIIATSFLIISLGIFLHFTRFSIEPTEASSSPDNVDFGPDSCVPGCHHGADRKHYMAVQDAPTPVTTTL